MKNTASELLWGKNTVLNGIIALSIIAVIALGCSCNKEFGDLGKTDNSTTASNTTSTTNTLNTPVTKADASTGQVPTDDQIQEMAKTTVLDFNDAIQKEDFTVFHRNISKPFQKEASPERFKQVFKSFIDANIDFSEIRSKPAYLRPTTVDKSRGTTTLNLKGSYATSPRPTNFYLKYIPEGKEWKLIALEIDTTDQSGN